MSRASNLEIVRRLAPKQAPRSMLEEEMVARIKRAGLPAPEARDYRFCAHACGGPGRGLRDRLSVRGWKDWQLDLAWPSLRVAVEIEGLGVSRKNQKEGAGTVGRHQSHAGYDSDCRKYNVATIELGWKLVRATSKMVRDGTAVQMLRIALSEATAADSPVQGSHRNQ